MSLFHGLLHRIRTRIAPARYAREREEELRIHQRMERTRDAVRHQAWPSSAPDVPHPDQELVPVLPRVMDWIRQDLVHAARGLIRTPGFTAMIVVTLALGVGANAAVFSLVGDVFAPPPGVDQEDALRRLYLESPVNAAENQASAASPTFNYPSFRAVEEAVGAAGALAAWTPSAERTFRVGETELPVRASWVTHDFFEVLGVHPERGRLLGSSELRIEVPTPVAVISHGLWERVFAGDPGVIGETIGFEGTVYTIVGVTAEGFVGLDFSLTEIFLPINTFPGSSVRPDLPWYEWGGGYLRVVARLQDGLDDGSLSARATAGFQRQPPIPYYSFDSTAAVVAGPIVEAKGPSVLDEGIPISTRLAGVTLMVLLIASANVASLLLVRAMRRRREIAVRIAIGISRERLIAQLLAESLVLALLAGSAAVALAAWAGELLRRLLMPAVQWANPALDTRTLAVVGVTVAATGLFAGLLPILSSRMMALAGALKADQRAGGARHSLTRTALLSAQIAFSIVLLVGAALFVRSLGQIDALPLGYEVDELIRVTVPTAPIRARPGGIEEAAARIASLPGVARVALTSSEPLAGYESQSVYLPGREEPLQLASQEPTYNQVSPEFFETSGIDIIAGRGFSAGDSPPPSTSLYASASVAIVNETMAQSFWPGETPIGRCLAMGAPDSACTEIVGISENFRLTEVIEEPKAQFFVPLGSEHARSILIRMERGASDNTIARETLTALEAVFGPSAFRVGPLSDALAPQLRPWRLGAQLFTGFGFLAVLVTVFGVYSVTSYTVSQRTHEMGVRIALGARTHDILRLVLAQGLTIIGIGIVLGVTVALSLGRLVEPLLYGVTPRDPMAIAAASVLLIVVGTAACVVPARRAGKVDPVRALAGGDDP